MSSGAAKAGRPAALLHFGLRSISELGVDMHAPSWPRSRSVTFALLLAAACGSGADGDSLQAGSSAQDAADVTSDASHADGQRDKFGATAQIVNGQVWLVGGVQGSPEAWAAVNELVIADEGGRVQARLPLPIARGRFLDRAAVTTVGDISYILGVVCNVPTSELAGCPSSDATPSLLTVRGTSIEGVELLAARPPTLENGAVPNFVLEIIGSVPEAKQVVVGVATAGPLLSGTHQSETVTIFTIGLDDRSVEQIASPPTPVLNSRSACIDDGRLYALSAEFELETGATNSYVVNGLDLASSDREWVTVGELVPPQPFGQGSFSLHCGSGLQVLAEAPNTWVTQLSTEDPGRDPIHTDLGGSPIGVVTTGGRTILTALSGDRVVAWELEGRGAWRQVASAPYQAPDVPDIVPIGDRLVDLGATASRSSSSSEAVPVPEFGR